MTEAEMICTKVSFQDGTKSEDVTENERDDIEDELTRVQ